MDSVKSHANAVIELLRSFGHGESARRLEGLVRDLDVPESCEAALNRLIASCHVRALGDLNVQPMEWQDWLKRLDKLQRACKRELKRQGKEDWESKRLREKGQRLERRKRSSSGRSTASRDRA